MTRRHTAPAAALRAGLDGWSLTEAGKAENECQLAAERDSADPGGVVAAAHRDFAPLNARLLRADTDWQIRPAGADRLGLDRRDVPSPSG